MKVAVTGSHGFIGRHLVSSLLKRGHEVTRLVRHAPTGPGEVGWNPDHPTPIPAVNGYDALIHLAGAAMAARRWTTERMALIRDSRVAGTRNLFRGLHALHQPPRILLCASATGYYGDSGDEPVDESAEPGGGFLAGVCQEWEAAGRENAPGGSRLAWLRFGIVLSPDGGALSNMLPFFRLGLGGPLAGGRFYMSWIDIEDVSAAVHHLLEAPDADGAFNLTAPRPVRNREFSRALGHVLRRLTFWPIPTFALRLLYGHMSNEVLVRGCRVLPARLNAAGFRFRYPDIDSSLRHLFGSAK